MAAECLADGAGDVTSWLKQFFYGVMNMRSAAITATATAAILWAGTGFAAPLSPSFQIFGDLPQATFGGTQIPTNPTAISTIAGLDDDMITFGLSATQRFNNPALSNDGNGTYFAGTGSNDGTPGSNAGLLGSTWNINFFVEIEGDDGNEIGDYGIQLLYDFDPGVDTDESALGVIESGDEFPGQLSQGSQNLLFPFLAVSVDPLEFDLGGGVIVNFGGSITAPGGSFDPTALGQYSFALRSTVLDAGVSINVETIPLPGAAILLLTALGGLLVVRRKTT